MKYLLIAASFVTLHAHAQVEYKGLPLGSPKADLLAQYPGLVCTATTRNLAALGEEQCVEDGNRTYAGLNAWDTSFGIVAGRVEQFSLKINSFNYANVRNVLKEAHGAGVETTRSVRNGAGRTFESGVWEVDKGGATITLFEHAANINEGLVVGQSKAFRAWAKKAAPAEAKKGTKDL